MPMGWAGISEGYRKNVKPKEVTTEMILGKGNSMYAFYHFPNRE